MSYRLYDYAYEICEEVMSEELKDFQQLLEKLAQPRLGHVLSLIGSFLVGLSQYMLIFNKNAKRHKACYLRRKLRQLGASCFYVSKNNYALYD
ncbi:MAG: hypothetical protein JSS62_03045 [Verrucomicrobia bacterium]|nr:hypothetical protein [Verrucomicrobiota bacterium]MBS0646033.1 hypothetical protein [Verrucomicrobiota bacterium]